MKKYGTSYYYATLFFPESIKDKVVQLYAFVRIPDLVVDVKDIDPLVARKELLNMWNEWEGAYKAKDVEHFRWGESVKLFYECAIPFELSKSFWEAMLLDTEKFRYDNYTELQSYMYGSAMVVGEMMCYVIGSFDERALPHAMALGEAMQLTNFLRDVQEDYKDLHRIYMPLEDLQLFGLDHDSIKNFVSTGEISLAWKSYMQYQIDRAEELYTKAFAGLQYLPWESRNAIYLSAKLYQGILRKIEKHDYNVFARSARTGKRDKLRIVVSHMRKYFY